MLSFLVGDVLQNDCHEVEALGKFARQISRLRRDAVQVLEKHMVIDLTN